MELKDRIKKARLDAGYTQVELAKEVNRLTKKEGSGVEPEKFTQVQVSDIERGKAARSVYVPHIAVACGVSAAWLAFGIEPVKAEYDKWTLERSPSDENLTPEDMATLRRILGKVS